jgi:hypothetical protein
VFFTCRTFVGKKIVLHFIWKYRKLLKSNVHISFLKLVVSVINVKRIILRSTRKIIWKSIRKLGEFRWKNKLCKVNSLNKQIIKYKQRIKKYQKMKNQIWPSLSYKYFNRWQFRLLFSILNKNQIQINLLRK